MGGDTGSEIRSAVQSGKEVTVHERQINAHGWSGYGYTIIDPETGAGGYIIEGKGRGGFISDDLVLLFGLMGLVAGAFGTVGAVISVLIGLILLIDGVLDLLAIENCSNIPIVEFWVGLTIFSIVISALGLLLSPPAGIVLAAFGLALFCIGAVLGPIAARLLNLSCVVEKR